MFARIRNLVAAAREIVASLEPKQVAARDAVELVDLFAELERLAVAGRTMAARRVEETKAWHGGGHLRIADWVAARAQTTVSAAIDTLETGRRLDELPATREAFASGALSAQQAYEITSAAAANPNAEDSLLDAAQKDSMKSLRQQCRQVIAAASKDTDADERISRSRYLRFWTDVDGAVRLDARLTQDAGAKIIAATQAHSRVLQEQARKAGSKERRECYAADALVALADASTPGPRAVVNVLVDYAAIKRGALGEGEKCEIAGLGPVSVAAARRLVEDGIINAVLTEDADVRAVATISRMIPARVRAALEARDTVCVIPWCDETKGLEIHHIKPVAEGGLTMLENLARPCHFHHMLITHRGWRLLGGPGEWQFLPPERRGRPPPDG